MNNVATKSRSVRTVWCIELMDRMVFHTLILQSSNLQEVVVYGVSVRINTNSTIQQVYTTQHCIHFFTGLMCVAFAGQQPSKKVLFAKIYSRHKVKNLPTKFYSHNRL